MDFDNKQKDSQKTPSYDRSNWSCLTGKRKVLHYLISTGYYYLQQWRVSFFTASLWNLIKQFDNKKDSLHKTGVTNQLLWVEYVTQYPHGYKCSQYCHMFRKCLKDSYPAFHWGYSPAKFTQIDLHVNCPTWISLPEGWLAARSLWRHCHTADLFLRWPTTGSNHRTLLIVSMR